MQLEVQREVQRARPHKVIKQE
eukprot:COSAG01_NODE_65357_length_273_cov_1.183908_1_plen_21_part_01